MRYPSEKRARRRVSRISRVSRIVRAALAMAGALAIAAGAASACKSGNDAAAEAPDAGSAVGAEVSVTVIGRGRVSSVDHLIDCPGTCFGRASLAERDGGPSSVPLAFRADNGARFAGWTVETVPMGMRVDGPSECSPMMRTSTRPSFQPDNPLLVLPFGETEGTPPSGHEGACANVKRVPLAYVVVAKFEEDRPPNDKDSGGVLPPVVDEVLFQPLPGEVSSAKEIGFAHGELVWRFETGGGLSGVRMARPDDVTPTLVQPASMLVSLFHVDQQALLVDASGSLYVVTAARTLRFLGDASSCLAVAADATHAYCRATAPDSLNATTILSWSLTGSIQPPTVVQSIPSNGSALAVDADHFYFSTEDDDLGTRALSSAPLEGDGGLPPIAFVAASVSAPRELTVGSSFLFWLDSTGGGSDRAVSALKSGSTAPFVALLSPGLVTLAADPTLAQYWVARDYGGTFNSGIFRASAGGTTSTAFRSKLSGIRGLVVDESYVYWTRDDGNVYRAPKNGDDL